MSTRSGPGGSLQTPYRNLRPSGHQPPDLQDRGLKSTRPLGACARQLYTGRQSKVPKGTSIVDEQIQSGPGPQELFAEAVDGLQTGQVQMHVRHVGTSCFLSGKVATLKLFTVYFSPITFFFINTSTLFRLCSTCWMSVMAAWALFRFRQARITLAPLLAKCSAVALPMPVFPPGETPQSKNSHVALFTAGRILSLQSPSSTQDFDVMR